MERHDRSPSCGCRALRRPGRRGRGGELRAPARARGGGAVRGPLDPRLQHLRRRDRDRPACDERRAGGPAGAGRARPGRRAVGRARRGHRRARARGDRRAGARHRGRRARAWQRQRMARADVRLHLREHDLRRGRDSGRRGRPGEPGREPGSVLGPARRRRQLRRRDRVRVPAAPGRPAADRGAAAVAARAGGRGDPLLPRLHGQRAGQGRRRRRLPDRAAGAVRAAGPAGPAGRRRCLLLRRPAGRRRGAGQGAARSARLPPA